LAASRRQKSREKRVLTFALWGNIKGDTLSESLRERAVKKLAGRSRFGETQIPDFLKKSGI
jgi:hypothetical protein